MFFYDTSPIAAQLLCSLVVSDAGEILLLAMGAKELQSKDLAKVRNDSSDEDFVVSAEHCNYLYRYSCTVPYCRQCTSVYFSGRGLYYCNSVDIVSTERGDEVFHALHV